MKRIARICSRILCASSLIWLFACATEDYRYIPSGPQDQVDRWRGDERFLIQPSWRPEAPVGSVRVSSSGVKDLSGADHSGNKTPVLDIEFSISNQSDQPWTLDIRKQSVAYPNQGSYHSVFASSDDDESGERGMPSVFTIKPGELRVVQVYFPLAKGQATDRATKMTGAKDLKEFELRWDLEAGSENVSNSAYFNRRTVPDRYWVENDPYFVGFGYSGWWGPRMYWHH